MMEIIAPNVLEVTTTIMIQPILLENVFWAQIAQLHIMEMTIIMFVFHAIQLVVYALELVQQIAQNAMIIIT